MFLTQKDNRLNGIFIAITATLFMYKFFIESFILFLPHIKWIYRLLSILFIVKCAESF